MDLRGKLNKYVEQSFLNRLRQAWEIYCNRLEAGRGLGKPHLLTAVLWIPAVAIAGDRILGWMDPGMLRQVQLSLRRVAAVS